jgi:hypothetical protein
MRPITVVLGLACLLAAACGGDKAPETSTNSAPDVNAPAASEELVSASAVLGNAARNAKEVDSFRGVMEMEMSFGPMSMEIDGDLVFRAPDASYVTMDMFGQQLEVLVYGVNVYMRLPGDDWMMLDLASAGIDLGALEGIAENKGFMDLQALADSLGELEELGDDTIDGKTYAHYRAEPDFEDLMAQLPEGFFDPSLVDQVEGAVDWVNFEFWIDETTELPRRFEMAMEMELEGESSSVLMAFDFLEYNTPVDIPAEPVDAPPFDPGLLGG